MRTLWLGIAGGMTALLAWNVEPAHACGLKLTVQAPKVKRMVHQSAHPAKILVLGEPSGNLETSLEQAGHRVEVAAQPEMAKDQQYGVILVSASYADTAKTRFPNAQIVAMGKSTQKNLANVEDALERKPIDASGGGRELLAAGPTRGGPVKSGPDDTVARRDQNTQPINSGSEAETTPPPSDKGTKPTEVAATTEVPAALARNDEIPAKSVEQPAKKSEPREEKAAEKKPEPKSEPVVAQKAQKDEPQLISARREVPEERAEKAEKAEKEEKPAPQKKEHHAAEPKTNEFFFSLGSHGLSDGTRNALGQHARWLKEHPTTTVTLQGHADATGSPDLNRALSQKRANGVAKYLSGLGIEKSRIKTEAFGDEQPVYQPGTNPKNRCVVIVRSE